MIEVNGWIKISLSTDGEGEDDIDDAIVPLVTLVKSIHSRQNIVEIRPLNGRYFINISNHANHKGREFEEILDLIKYIASNFEGSYGIVYVRDDESDLNEDNEFIVYKIARGSIYIERDCYLSPCNPVIED